MAVMHILIFIALLLSSVIMLAALLAEGQGKVLSPDMSTCNAPSDIPALELEVLHCCAPPVSTGSATDLPLFRPDNSSSSSTATGSLRVRPPAHKANATTLARAYALMKALPPEDPRSFAQQANIHCAYCNAVYNQTGSTQHRFVVHGNWLFFPFHRWYLYFHERILAKLLAEDGATDDEADSFALPFWNYDHPDGASLPWMYHEYAELNNSNRNPEHAPPTVLAIDYAYNLEPRPAAEQLRENAAYVYRALIRDAYSQARFFGGAIKPGDAPQIVYGTVEEFPHNSVHVWTGSATTVGGKDMGSFYAAARDPVFYAHHAQLDRMWELWKQLRPGENVDMVEEEYLEAEFAFYNENSELVRVKVGDSLDTTRLGYVYEEVELPWLLDGAPVRLSPQGAASFSSSDDDLRLCNASDLILEPCSAAVARDMAAVSRSPDEERLVIAGLSWTSATPAILDVFLNLPNASASTPSACEEFVGTFHNAPQFSEGFNSSDFRLRIGDRIRALGLADEATLLFTFVPKGLRRGSATTFSSLYIQYYFASADDDDDDDDDLRHDL